MRPLAALCALLLLASCRATQQELDVSDPGIKARVEAALRGRSDLDLRFVTVDVVDRVVTVSGLVPSAVQIREIRRVVRTQPGVESALVNLVVNE